VQEVPARRIITRNESPDIGFDRSINPYRGCEHGCIYCFARPTHAFLGLSPGLDFETKLFAKTKTEWVASVFREQTSYYRLGKRLADLLEDAGRTDEAKSIRAKIRR